MPDGPQLARTPRGTPHNEASCLVWLGAEPEFLAGCIASTVPPSFQADSEACRQNSGGR